MMLMMLMVLMMLMMLMILLVMLVMLMMRMMRIMRMMRMMRMVAKQLVTEEGQQNGKSRGHLPRSPHPVLPKCFGLQRIRIVTGAHTPSGVFNKIVR